MRNSLNLPLLLVSTLALASALVSVVTAQEEQSVSKDEFMASYKKGFATLQQDSTPLQAKVVVEERSFIDSDPLKAAITQYALEILAQDNYVKFVRVGNIKGQYSDNVIVQSPNEAFQLSKPSPEEGYMIQNVGALNKSTSRLIDKWKGGILASAYCITGNFQWKDVLFADDCKVLKVSRDVNSGVYSIEFACERNDPKKADFKGQISLDGRNNFKILSYELVAFGGGALMHRYNGEITYRDLGREVGTQPLEIIHREIVGHNVREQRTKVLKWNKTKVDFDQFSLKHYGLEASMQPFSLNRSMVGIASGAIGCVFLLVGVRKVRRSRT